MILNSGGHYYGGIDNNDNKNKTTIVADRIDVCLMISTDCKDSDHYGGML